MSLLKKDITKKKQVNENTMKLAKLDISNDNGKYQVEAICDSRMYIR